MAPNVAPPTEVTNGEDAGNFCSLTKPESPDAKTREMPRAPTVASDAGSCEGTAKRRLLWWWQREFGMHWPYAQQTRRSCGASPVSYTHLTLPTICSV
eukprot:5927300-Prymnesium_polylepis.2